MALLELIAVNEQSRTLAGMAANDGFNRRILVLILIFLTVADIGQTQTAIRGLYPPVTELSKFKAVKASSTCGLNNMPMTYCMSSLNNQTLINCTRLNCLLDCCSTCGKTQPIHTNILSGSGVLVTQVTDTRPGSATGSRSSSFSTGSYITYANLPASNKQLGMSVCSWIKKQSSGPGYRMFSNFLFLLATLQLAFLLALSASQFVGYMILVMPC